MTNPINYEKQSIPAYSGITINITNPTLNAAPLNTNPQQNPNLTIQQPYSQQPLYSEQGLINQQITTENQGLSYNKNYSEIDKYANNLNTSSNINTSSVEENKSYNRYVENTAEQNYVSKPQEQMPQAYPPQYYLNNYNYVQNNTQKPEGFMQPYTQQQFYPASQNIEVLQPVEEEVDMSSSEEIIENLDAKVAEQKDLEKNGKKTRVVALTNEYIMSLENYLNNPNSEIRLMASKEVLKRLDEDKDRYDDAALNALLNKMLQDPNKLIRIAAMSAFASQLASGNDFTVSLLKDIESNPNSDKDDVLQAADILLKMSSSTEVKYVPKDQKEQKTSNKELEVSQQEVA